MRFLETSGFSFGTLTYGEGKMSKWRTEYCADCGTEIYIHEDWDNPPRLCKSCKQAKWYDISCEGCGATVHVHRDWENPPKFCKSCKATRAAKWYDKSCERCGATIHVHRDWEHPPQFCKSCKAERTAQWYEKRCKGCGATIRVHRDWENPPNYCSSCKAAYQAQRQQIKGQKHWVDKSHYRVVSADGRKSYLYETNGWTSWCVGITDHHPGGTTEEFEVDHSFLGIIRSVFTGNLKGKKK